MLVSLVISQLGLVTLNFVARFGDWRNCSKPDVSSHEGWLKLGYGRSSYSFAHERLLKGCFQIDLDMVSGNSPGNYLEAERAICRLILPQ